MDIKIPVADLHCDLLSYLVQGEGRTPNDVSEIGCALPHLQHGGVKLQVMAIFSPTQANSTTLGMAQAQKFAQLSVGHKTALTAYTDLPSGQQGLLESDKIHIMASVESASVFCTEDEPLGKGLERYQAIEKLVGKVLYVSLTHHAENRFGGGNYTEVGLKPDGLTFLKHLDGAGTAIDLSHTSRALADDVINALDKYNLDIPLIASHSNYDQVWTHTRNLTPAHAMEIVKRKGLIGVNFLREFVNREDPEAIYEHVLHGFSLGDGSHMALGADYFYTNGLNKPERQPYFHAGFDDASCYPMFFKALHKRGLSIAQLEALGYRNFERFIRQVQKLA